MFRHVITFDIFLGVFMRYSWGVLPLTLIVVLIQIMKLGMFNYIFEAVAFLEKDVSVTQSFELRLFVCNAKDIC